MKRLRQLLVDRPGSIAGRMRDRRLEEFSRLMQGKSHPRILDLGGTVNYWCGRGADLPWQEWNITLVNLSHRAEAHPDIETIEGDVRDLSRFAEMSFDAVFSNSVIEHLGTLESQSAMASEVRRLAPIYSVQTPNFFFPLEPHFLVPGWQWLPVSLRVRCLRRWHLGHVGRVPDHSAALEQVESIRLLRKSELGQLFPDAQIIPERVGPLIKSWVAVRNPAQ